MGPMKEYAFHNRGYKQWDPGSAYGSQRRTALEAGGMLAQWVQLEIFFQLGVHSEEKIGAAK